MEELNRSVHTWIEESEHSGANSDDGLSSPSAAGGPQHQSPLQLLWEQLPSSEFTLSSVTTALRQGLH